MGFIQNIFIVGVLANVGVSGGPVEEKELFLTPLIKSGALDKARAASEDNMKVHKIQAEREVKSYSGYLTINEKAHSNLFFWFFPAQENPGTAPVILWINEIPGYTSLKGIFLETGPFYVTADSKLVNRNSSWTRTHSMLYIDAPAGSGFSFADDKSAYATSSVDEANELYEALIQFFTLFKEFQPNPFYLAGETYAGTFIPAIIKKLDMENEKAALKINIKGGMMGGPYFHKEQLRKADYYYHLGLIDEQQRKEFDAETSKCLDFINAGKFDEAAKVSAKLNLGGESMLAKLTGFHDARNAMADAPPDEIGYFTKFIETKEVHNYLHTGVHKFVEFQTNIFDHFGKDMFSTHVEPLEYVLDKGYRILIYIGQFDIFLTQDMLYKCVRELKWKGQGDFEKAPRTVWKVGKSVAGYSKSAHNLMYVIVRNAGNYAILDQPEWTTDMAERFLANKDFH